MYRNNLYNPYYNNYYKMPKMGKFTWDGFLNNAHRTLNVINEALPIYKEVQPMFKNMGTIFKVINELKAPAATISTAVSNTPTFFT